MTTNENDDNAEPTTWRESPVHPGWSAGRRPDGTVVYRSPEDQMMSIYAMMEGLGFIVDAGGSMRRKNSKTEPEWIAEARRARILPWRGATVVDCDGDRYTVVEDPDADGVFEICAVIRSSRGPHRESVSNAEVGHPGDWGGVILDLADPDTRAAFDRRLALRLGIEETKARPGVRVYVFDHRATSGPLWFHESAPDVDEDVLLARVRMWASVTP